MKIKKWKQKIAVLTSIGILLSAATTPNVLAFSTQQSTTSEPKVSINQVKEIAEGVFSNIGYTGTPSQSLANTIAFLVWRDDASKKYSAYDVLKFLYPNDSDEQLKTESISSEQALKWLHSVGYVAEVIDRPLTTDEIKKSINDSEPVVTIFENQDSSYWLEQESAGILYAHDDVDSEGYTLHQSFIKTYNHEEFAIDDGKEGEALQFPNMADGPDETARNSKFRWSQSIIHIKKDPSWDSHETIREDRKNGIFNVNLTKEGNNIVQADFTDADVLQLNHQFNKDDVTLNPKLGAVSLINLYFDTEHQKTVSDLEKFLNITSSTNVSLDQIGEWYKSLGFDFDIASGKISKELTKKINSEGKIYLSVFNAINTTSKDKTTVGIGAGFTDNSFGYIPFWQDPRDWEQIHENYIVDWSKPDAAEQLKQAQQKYQYDNFRVLGGEWGETEKGYYDTNKIIYNIRAKDIPTISSSATNFTTTKINTTDSLLAKSIQSAADYVTVPDFGIRETQSQQPWCSRFVNAAAVNTVYKAKDTEGPGSGAITTAKKLMQLEFPNMSDEELENFGGGTVGECLEVLQKNYQVTADFEQRALSFDEVKKELDNDGIIQMDGTDNDDTSTNISDKSGHAVAIVGYVMPKDGDTTKHPPYYEVWNPWWQKTFYLSSKSNTFRLGGVNYKWNRTWHKWRKSNSPVKIDKALRDIKVAEYGSEATVFDLTNMVEWGYSYSTDHDRKTMRARMDGSHEYGSSNNPNAVAFKEGVDSMRSNLGALEAALPLSVITVIVGLVSAGATSAVISEIISGLGGAAGPGAMYYCASEYLKAEKKVDDTWYHGIQ